MLNNKAIGLLVVVTLLSACGPQADDVGPVATPTVLAGAHSDAYPVPATAGRPEPYPGETVFPTFDPTKGAAMEKTNIAVATARTASLVQTATAEAASRPTSASVPTRTPPAVPTQLVINSKPDCVPGSDYTHCHDAVLAIDFDYPSSWGETSARYFTGGYAGNGYEYDFSVQNLGHQAGGRSRDFSEGRGAFLTDFYGFEADPAGNPNICASYRATICRMLQTQVVFMMSLPKAEIVCQSGPDDYVSWMGLVAINLPKGPKINGFIFGSPVFSENLSKELDVLLDVDPKAQQAKCQDAAARQQFDAKVKQIVDAVQSGTVDPGTQANIDQLVHIAQSIRFD